MNLTRYRKERILPILINRTVIFFFLMCLLTLFLYVAGTAQGFIDSTQIFLLRLYVVLGFFLTTASIFGVFLDLGRFIKRKKPRYIFRAGAYLFMVFFGIVTVIAALFIIVLSEGNDLT